MRLIFIKQLFTMLPYIQNMQSENACFLTVFNLYYEEISYHSNILLYINYLNIFNLWSVFRCLREDVISA